MDAAGVEISNDEFHFCGKLFYLTYFYLCKKRVEMMNDGRFQMTMTLQPTMTIEFLEWINISLSICKTTNSFKLLEWTPRGTHLSQLI